MRHKLLFVAAFALSAAACDDPDVEARSVEIADFCEPVEERADNFASAEAGREVEDGAAYVCAPEDLQAFLDGGGELDGPTFRMGGGGSILVNNSCLRCPA